MTENGFEYVDLGLPSGTMWATCNVGATELEDYGLLFQFGCTNGYRYDDTNHKFRTNTQNLEDGLSNKYIPLTTSGKTYNAGETLDLADDAAHVNMGGKWRMPTKDELKELFDNTTHDVVTINGVKCMMFISKINNKRLFVPFAGWWHNGNYYNAGSYASVWSSQVHSSDVDTAYTLDCYSRGNAYVSHSYSSAAFSVRGVFNINEHKNNVEHTNNVEYADNINMLI